MYRPSYRITPYLLNLIDQASYLRSWIDHAPLKVTWLPVMQKEARAKTAHYSTSIEGNPLSLTQVKAIDRGEVTGAPQTQEKEVANYLKALRSVEKIGKHGLTEETVLHLHALLTQGLLPAEKVGHYKTKQNYIVDEEGVKRFTPPSPKETPTLVRKLIDWLTTKETRKLHCILVAAIFHHRFVSIHPFSDGNGRLARVICAWLLYQREYDLHHIFSLDEFFAGDRQRYYDKLQQARGLDGDLTYWIEYVAEGIGQTLSLVKKRIEGLQVTTSYPIILSPRQEELLRMLRDNPHLQVAEFQKKFNITRSRVNQIITPLVKTGLVKKEGASRLTRYSLDVH